jgi:hypothetical protein
LDLAFGLHCFELFKLLVRKLYPLLEKDAKEVTNRKT